ncbi:GAF domain-containing protein [Couchioplanes caeruleus]|uniref:GAF domain-containing protein n=1 Tax=Couchioplanes caeruleus TaxID=56438 RepID=UPI0020BF8B12|nr:GAF domain-containing protein [Couchioplanes caeruleus]UQU63958.1 GAF domain-containing protein [Couchioplanes caeruleus]
MPEGETATRRPRVLQWISYCVAFLTPVCAAIASVGHGWSRWSWVAATAACAVIVARLNHVIQGALQEQAKAASDRLDAALGKVSPPLVEILQQLCLAADSRGRSQQLGHLNAVVAEAAKASCGDGDTRAVLYLTENHRPPTGRAHKNGDCLKRAIQRGRLNEAAREWFCAGANDEGKAVLDFIKGTKGRLYKDIIADPPPGVSDAKVRKYRSLMAVPVRANETAFGMLAVDHPKPGVFDKGYLALLVLLASTVGTAMAIDMAAERADREKV